jgi:hypothetical protein
MHVVALLLWLQGQRLRRFSEVCNNCWLPKPLAQSSSRRLPSVTSHNQSFSIRVRSGVDKVAVGHIYWQQLGFPRQLSFLVFCTFIIYFSCPYTDKCQQDMASFVFSLNLLSRLVFKTKSQSPFKMNKVKLIQMLQHHAWNILTRLSGDWKSQCTT